MSWFFIALIGPALWSLTNHIDKYMVSRYFRGGGVGALLIISSLIGIVVLPLALWQGPEALSFPAVVIIGQMISGALYVLGLFPYLYSLQRSEASVVVPLFQMVPVFAYILGVIFLGEQLSGPQLVGSVLIIAGAVIIAADLTHLRRARIDGKVFAWMALASLLIACYSLLFKYFTVSTGSFWANNFWQYLGYVAVAIVALVCVPSYRREFLGVVRANSTAILSLNFSNEVLNTIAKLAVDYATLLAPLALVWVANGFQPLFVFVYGLAFSIFLPKFSQERLDRRTLLQKFCAILIIFAGVSILS